MNKTKIEYLNFTWSPVTGCTPVSSGCEHCYARRMHERGLFGKQSFSEVTLHPERLDEPLRRKKPARIGVAFMGDLFHKQVPDQFIESVLAIITRCPKHTFLLLTKRPQRFDIMAKDALRISRTDTWPIRNLWLGVSVEDQPSADERIPWLLRTPAALRWISLEPMLSDVSLNQIMVPEGLPPERERRDGPWTLTWNPLTGQRTTSPYSSYIYPEKIDWVVLGGESGPGARPMDPDWARSVRDQCKVAGVPFYMKQMSGRAPIPDDLMVKEMPNAARLPEMWNAM